MCQCEMLIKKSFKNANWGHVTTPPTTLTVSYSWQTYKLQPHSNKHDLSGTKSK